MAQKDVDSEHGEEGQRSLPPSSRGDQEDCLHYDVEMLLQTKRLAKATEWGVRIAAVALILSTAAFIAAWLTVQATWGQLNAMRDDQRAWIQVKDVHPVGDLSFSAHRANGAPHWQVPILFEVVNIGKSPAFDIDFSFPMSLSLLPKPTYWPKSRGSNEYMSHLVKDCKVDSGRRIPMVLRSVIFPNESFTPSKFVFGTDNKFDHDRWYIDKFGSAPIFEIAACIRYKTATDSKVHHTVLTFNIAAPALPVDYDQNGFPANGDDISISPSRFAMYSPSVSLDWAD